MMPSDFTKHGFSQGCPGCTYAQNGSGPKRNHSEACRRRMEEEIGKDASDTRADSQRKTTQLHRTTRQHGEHLEEREGYLRKEDVNEP